MTASSKLPTRTLHSRFIPREELRAFSAWAPGSLGAETAPASEPAPPMPVPAPEPEPAPPPPPDPQELLLEARQGGYKDGYRDGLSALENFKQSYAAQITAQVGRIAQSFGERLDGIEHELAASLALLATDIAQQVVRAEIRLQPERIEAVAQEALAALVHSARHIRVHVHPDDHALLTARGQLDLSARGARLVANAEAAAGGCLVESDVGGVDASVPARWRAALASLGQPGEWRDSLAPHDEQDLGEAR
jgi:flagellar assembly protein FliH